MRRALLIGLPLLGVLGGGAAFWFLLHRHSPVELAQDALAHGEAYKAELTLDKFLQSHPNDPAGNFEMGLVNLVKQNPVAAEQRFKSISEAYQVLGKPELRQRYDKELAKGRIRMDLDKKDSEPPPPTQRTLEMIALTPGGKKLAAKADRLLSIGKLEEARVQLTGAFQHEPGNAELHERIQLLYEALALEPG